MTRARLDRRGGRGRFVALVLAAGALAGGGVLGNRPGHEPPRTALQPAALAADAAPLASTSSSWFCPGGPGGADGTTQVLLANAGPRAVRIGAVVVNARGVHRRDDFILGPHAESAIAPAQLVHGAWLASRVAVAGGAESAVEMVDGPRGRAVAPCASEVSSHWYFASGSTKAGSTLSVALFNPTPNLAVVDLSFVTGSGFTAPAPFQGIVVKPWALLTLTVGRYVQNQGSVATVVAARTGAVVAEELELYGSAGTAGLSLALGAPAPSTRWDLPSVEDASGGASALAVFNPSERGEHVVVAVRLPTGPVEPFTQTVGPQSVWTLTTSDQLRIGTDQPYTVEVRSTGPGTVVARVGAGGPLGPAPWWAADLAVNGLETSAAHRWLIAALPAGPSPTTALAAQPHASRFASSELVVENPGARPVGVDVTWWGASGTRHDRRLRVPGHGRTAVVAPGRPVVVRADLPIAVVGDASPAGIVGVVGIPAVPLR